MVVARRTHACQVLALTSQVDEVLAFKSSMDTPPENSGLASDTFVLLIQTQHQKEVFKKYGHSFAGIDVMHNTTYHMDMILFTLIIWD